MFNVMERECKNMKFGDNDKACILFGHTKELSKVYFLNHRLSFVPSNDFLYFFFTFKSSKFFTTLFFQSHCIPSLAYDKSRIEGAHIYLENQFKRSLFQEVFRRSLYLNKPAKYACAW